MNYYDEVLNRLAQRIRIEDNLSEDAYRELLIHLDDNPQEYVKNDEDASYLCLAEGLEVYGKFLGTLAAETTNPDEIPGISIENVESADMLLREAYSDSLKLYPDNIDALYLKLFHGNDVFGVENLMRLKDMVGTYEQTLTENPSVFTRPYQRLHASYICALVQNAAYLLAIDEGSHALKYDKSDPFGVRHSMSLSLARLEDLPAFERLEEAFDRSSNCWSYLARIILLYRMNNLTAAKRTITGYTKLVPGSAHLLLAGTHIFPIPRHLGRPDTPTCSFKECTIATSEAYEIIEDTPGLREWANSIDAVRKSALDFQNYPGF